MRDAVRKDPNSPLSSVFAYSDFDNLTVAFGGEAEITSGQVVSGGYFAGLGVSPFLGRLIAEGDDVPSAAPAAVLSFGYWRDRFASDPAIIGREIKVNQIPFTVIGVTPDSFEPPAQVGQAFRISLPIAFEPLLEKQSPMVDTPTKLAPWWLNVMGRLKPGATLAQAQSTLDGPFQVLALQMMPAPTKPDQPATLEAKDYPHLLLRPGARGPWEMRSVYSPKIYLLFGVVGLVLLLACANVANLLLTRSAQRASEITVRLAMGASRGRLMRQMLTESLLLSALGGLLGALFAVWGKDALMAVGAFGSLLPTEVSYSLSWRVLLFTAGVSLATGVLFGFVPAWRSANLDLAPTLKEGSRNGVSITKSWITRSLVVAQVAVSLVLLVGAGLFLRTLLNLQRVDIGFNPRSLLVFNLNPGAAGYSGERLNQFYTQVSSRLDALPGASATTFAQMPLIARYYYGEGLILPGETVKAAPDRQTGMLMVRENYLKALQIPVIRGRGFTESDTEAGPKVAIVNETLAQKFFPGKDPIGKRIGFGESTLGQFEIVGVVRDIKYNRQREDKDALTFVPWRQWTEPMTGMTFSVRTLGDPLAAVKAVRDIVRGIDDAIPVAEVKTQVAQSAETLSEEGMYARLVGLFAALALLLAAIGLHGVMAYSVTQRRSEIGLRMALGARTGNVLRLILGQAVGLVTVGVVVGMVAALALRQVVASRLWGVEALDPATFALVSVTLLLTAVVASSIPARRAARVDPLKALRCE
jgi:predicted permease